MEEELKTVLDLTKEKAGPMDEETRWHFLQALLYGIYKLYDGAQAELDPPGEV